MYTKFPVKYHSVGKYPCDRRVFVWGGGDTMWPRGETEWVGASWLESFEEFIALYILNQIYIFLKTFSRRSDYSRDFLSVKHTWLIVSQTYVTSCQSNIRDLLSVKHMWLLVSQTYVTSCQSNIRDFMSVKHTWLLVSQTYWSGYRHIHFDFISMSVSRDLSVKRCQVQVVCYSIQ